MFRSEAVILLKDIQGEKNLGILEGLFKSNARPVHQGELLLSLPRAKVAPRRKDGNPAHNYQLSNDPSITLFCTEDDVAPLSDRHEYHLMEAVKSREARFEVFQNGKLDWGSKLMEGTVVLVTLPSKSSASNQHAISIIRYVGALPNEHGVNFGVEIWVSS